MNRRALYYIPLAVLFVFAAAAFYSHFSEIPQRYAFLNYDYRIPFSATERVNYVAKEAEASGLKVGDRILRVNGAEIDSKGVFQREVDKAGQTGTLDLAVRRSLENGHTEDLELSVPTVKLVRDLNFYLRLVIGFIFVYIFPLFCVLLGFWVVLIRSEDYLAWLLLFLLSGLASLGLEGFSQSAVLGSFKTVFGSSWALSMFLFGIYFPERFFLDRKLPWLKWLIIIPLGYQIFVVLLGQLKLYTGIGLIDFLAPVNTFYFRLSMPLNMVAIGLFFAILGWKSGTLENVDSRRRLRIMVVGTTVAMTPAFFIVLYSVFTGARGSFFDVAPSWFALLALLLVLLFPLTMAYVIVVERAMDVRVVVRQGIQYALARNGVKVLQGVLLVALIFAVIWIFRNFEGDVVAQVGFIAAGFALLPLIDYVAKRLRTWIDKRFFRDAYNSEQILLELSEDVRTMVETKPLLETVSTKISESLHVPQVALLLKNGSFFEPAFNLGFDTPPVVKLSSDSKSMQTLKRNQHIVIYDQPREITSTPTVSLEEREQYEGLNTQLLLPVAAKNELSGIISLSAKRSEEPYTASDLRLLKSVATQTGLALENSRLTAAIAADAAQKEGLARELEIAREVQERLFPQVLPEVEGLEYYGACRPALGVGGDYYDFLELAGGKFGFAIGDVSGKGIGAALMMASLQASLRGQALHSGDDLAGMLGQVNALIYETSTTNRYATFFYAQYDPATRKMTYVNAGHNPPFLLRADRDEPILLEAGGPVIGMLPPMIVSYTQGEIVLESGDLIAGFTDGISESMNPKEEEWGEDALLTELRTITHLSPTEILERIVTSADRFADGAKQHDDMTMIIIKVKK